MVLELENRYLAVSVSPKFGGRITSCRYDGEELLVKRGPDRASPLDWGWYPMAPWPGRVAGAAFEWDGKRVVLPRNEPQSAIHGLVFDRIWTVVESGDSWATISTALPATWPWPGRVTQSIGVEGNCLRLEMTVYSEESAFPAGAGWHPWFSRRGRDPRVRVDASLIYPTRPGDLLPLGPPRPTQPAENLRSGPRLGARRLDSIYAEVEPPILIDWGDIRAEVTFSENIRHVCVFTPPNEFCLEPQSCAADAFNLSARGVETGLALVTPERPLTVTSEWRIEGLNRRSSGPGRPAEVQSPE